MDAESLVQIEQIVTAAISKETQVLGASLRQEFGEKTAWKRTLVRDARLISCPHNTTLTPYDKEEWGDGC